MAVALGLTVSVLLLAPVHALGLSIGRYVASLSSAPRRATQLILGLFGIALLIRALLGGPADLAGAGFALERSPIDLAIRALTAEARTAAWSLVALVLTSVLTFWACAAALAGFESVDQGPAPRTPLPAATPASVRPDAGVLLGSPRGGILMVGPLATAWAWTLLPDASASFPPQAVRVAVAVFMLSGSLLGTARILRQSQPRSAREARLDGPEPVEGGRARLAARAGLLSALAIPALVAPLVFLGCSARSLPGLSWLAVPLAFGSVACASLPTWPVALLAGVAQTGLASLAAAALARSGMGWGAVHLPAAITGLAAALFLHATRGGGNRG